MLLIEYAADREELQRFDLSTLTGRRELLAFLAMCGAGGHWLLFSDDFGLMGADRA